MVSLHPATRSRPSGRIRRSAWCRSGSTGSMSPARNSRACRAAPDRQAPCRSARDAVARGDTVDQLDVDRFRHPARIGRQRSPSLRGLEQHAVDAMTGSGQRRAWCLASASRSPVWLVGSRLRRKAFQAHVADHFQLVDENADQFASPLPLPSGRAGSAGPVGPLSAAKPSGLCPGRADLAGPLPRYCRQQPRHRRSDRDHPCRQVPRASRRKARTPARPAACAWRRSCRQGCAGSACGRVLVGQCRLHLLQADALAVRPEQHALQPVVLGDRPEADDFRDRPGIDRGRRISARAALEVALRGRLRKARALPWSRLSARSCRAGIGWADKAVDRPLDHVGGLHRRGRRRGAAPASSGRTRTSAERFDIRATPGI